MVGCRVRPVWEVDSFFVGRASEQRHYADEGLYQPSGAVNYGQRPRRPPPPAALPDFIKYG